MHDSMTGSTGAMARPHLHRSKRLQGNCRARRGLEAGANAAAAALLGLGRWTVRRSCARAHARRGATPSRLASEPCSSASIQAASRQHAKAGAWPQPPQPPVCTPTPAASTHCNAPPPPHICTKQILQALGAAAWNIVAQSYAPPCKAPHADRRRRCADGNFMHGQANKQANKQVDNVG